MGRDVEGAGGGVRWLEGGIRGDNEVMVLAFFNLEQSLSQLHPEQSYLLYCDKGLMSRIQAQLMREKVSLKWEFLNLNYSILGKYAAI